eukprot:9501940-Pyramimonas_sp.AAC.1
MAKHYSVLLPRRSQRFQERSKVAPSGHGASQDSPERPKSSQSLRKPNDSCTIAFQILVDFDSRKMAPRGPKRAPRGAQDGPKAAPRAPKSATRAPQE